MSKIILTCIFLFLVTGIQAQTSKEVKHFTFATTIGTGIAVSTPASTPFTWQVLGYYHISRRFSAGIGTGLSFYEKTIIPLFADIKFNLTRPRKFTPYLECGAGYGFATDKQTNGGSFLNPSAGVEYAVWGDKKLFLAIGYEQQQLERLKQYENSLLVTEFAEKLHHNSISLKIGFVF